MGCKGSYASTSSVISLLGSRHGVGGMTGWQHFQHYIETMHQSPQVAPDFRTTTLSNNTYILPAVTESTPATPNLSNVFQEKIDGIMSLCAGDPSGRLLRLFDASLNGFLDQCTAIAQSGSCSSFQASGDFTRVSDAQLTAVRFKGFMDGGATQQFTVSRLPPGKHKQKNTFSDLLGSSIAQSNGDETVTDTVSSPFCR